jgi:hypothetical protein
MRKALDSAWGRLFRNWETARSTSDGFPDVGTTAPELRRTGLRALVESFRILGLCVTEAPEFGRRKRRMVSAPEELNTPTSVS